VIDTELMEMLESTVTIAPVASRGLDGHRNPGTPVEYRAHVEWGQSIVRNASGEDVSSAGRCHLDSYYPAVKETSFLTLPDGATPTIVAVTVTYDSAGPYQTVVAW